MALSSACLDVPTAAGLDRATLACRCVYPDDGADADDEFRCLLNYLGAGRGGTGPAPSIPVSLEAIGPCRVEFRAEVEGDVDGDINVFGVVVPADHHFGDVASVRYADASEEKRIGDADGVGDVADETSTRKRKSEGDGAADRKPSKPPAEISSPPESVAPSDGAEKKLSKGARKRLARAKARELEETLSAARDHAGAVGTGDAADDGAEEADDGTDGAEAPAKNKSKKRKKDKAIDGTERSEDGRPLSATRERRLAGGLIVADVLLGSGAPVKAGKKVSLHYKGSLRSTGRVFDKNASKQHPLVFRQGTGEVIRGLERGLEGMRAGGERVVTIPSKLGYGSKAQGEDIPADSDLVFEVKVLKVG